MSAGSSGAAPPPPLHRPRHRTLVITVAVAATVDLATKTWATVALPAGGINLPGPLDLRLAYNRGIAFSLLNSAPPALMLAATGAVTVVLAIAAWRRLLPTLPAGLILGGAVANLLDRLVGGSVVDVLHTGWWPTFNLADAFITFGVGLFVLGAFRAGDVE